jgi:AcrR family transcriptional regulator
MANDSHAPRGARARVRDELTCEIKEAARRQVTEHGSAALSLRAVAREVGMVSSAIYRYFPSRDELLTALIIDAYDAVGEAAEQAERSVRRTDFSSRWMAVSTAVRNWALAHPQEYALIFGSPVPGYHAPKNTIDPAARIPLLLLTIFGEAAQAGSLSSATDRQMPRSVHKDMSALREKLGAHIDDHQLGRSLLAWTTLMGSISFELFGHLHNVVHDYDAHFDYQMRGVAQNLGLSAPRPAATR